MPARQRVGHAGQHFLADQRVVERLLARLALRPGELVVDVGAGRGALTYPLAHAGARVIAVERDPRLVGALRRSVLHRGLAERVQVVKADLRRFRWPRTAYRVVANPPFGLTTDLLARLLDDPQLGPERAHLLVQQEVARRRVTQPPDTLRSAAWAPWWTFSFGERVDRGAFRPAPTVDAAWLHIERRVPPVLPEWLAPDFAETLRPVWRQLR